jgi:hypothetical protein
MKKWIAALGACAALSTLPVGPSPTGTMRALRPWAGLWAAWSVASSARPPPRSSSRLTQRQQSSMARALARCTGSQK